MHRDMRLKHQLPYLRQWIRMTTKASSGGTWIHGLMRGDIGVCNSRTSADAGVCAPVTLYGTHAVPGVQGSDLVSLRQRRIVESVLDKVV